MRSERLQDRDVVPGIPEVGLAGVQDDPIENELAAPAVVVDIDPAPEARGGDEELEKAVDVLPAKLPKL